MAHCPRWLSFLLCCCPLTVMASDAERLSDYRAFALGRDGNAEAGAVVFQSNHKAACADCHRITGMEKSGPNLDGIGEKYSKAEMITHLLEPSASIKRGYEQVTVLMKDGRTIIGRVERSNQLLLRLQDLKGKRINLKQADVGEVQFSKTSLMPTGLALHITQQEFADLIAYLRSLRFGVKHGLAAGGRPVEIPRIATPVTFVPIHTETLRFENPVWVGVFPLDKDQLLVVEHQHARVWRYVPDGPGGPRKELFVDLKRDVHIAGDQGLTSLALHPNFAANGRYFLEHEVREQGIVKTTIVERQATPDRLRDDGGPSRRLLEVRQPAANHNGGCIAFGPDGMLYAGFGDGGPQKDPNGYSQNASELLGSFIRINVDGQIGEAAYAVPHDNPYVGKRQDNPSVRTEVWATGFREPWRFSFDQVTGDLWVGDVGQSKFEEVCLVRAGENHGWNVREGFAPFSDEYKTEGVQFTDPLFAYEHGLGFSVTGGHVYRGDPQASFYGVYIFGDYNTRRIWGLRQEGGRLLDVREIATAPTDVASFGVDGRGELLLVAYSGEIFRIDFSRSRYE